jgi:hypothetical protein
MDRDASKSGENRRKLLGRYLDIGLPAGLLLAILAVLAVDRSIPTTVDLVFILDQRVIMRDLISGMKANCLEKAESLKAGGANCRFAVIPFGVKRNRIPMVPLTDDLEDFKQQLAAPSTEDRPEPAASGEDAIKEALALNFRKDTQVLFFLISKAPCQDSKEISAVAHQMEERGITTLVQADATEQEICKPLYQSGRFFSMEGEDLTDSKGRSNSRAANLLAKLAPGKQSDSQLVKAKGIYGMRTDPNRQKMIVSLGGTRESEIAVQAGLEWLARHQADDGYWSDGSKCEHDNGPCQSLKYGSPIAETGLAVLAFQAGGNYYFNDQEYSTNVKLGLDWLVEQQQSNGRLFGSHTWYDHGIATFALAEACAVSVANRQKPDARYLDAAQRAIAVMEECQYRTGGWRYDERHGPGDTSVTGWQVLALKSALEAEIDVKPETMERVRTFFESYGNPATGRTGYIGRGEGTELTTAVGLIVQEFILHQPDSQLARNAVKYLRQRSTQGIGSTGDFYTLYNCTLGMFLARGEAWDEWNEQVRDAIVNRQETNGCARGSWNHRYHRTLDTAWAVLTLEVYYRYSAAQTE